MGEKAGGLGESHARDQALPDGFPRRGGAGVEPAERIGGLRERGEQPGEVDWGGVAVRCAPGSANSAIVRRTPRSASVSSGLWLAVMDWLEQRLVGIYSSAGCAFVVQVRP
jgi:hypothetical protein